MIFSAPVLYDADDFVGCFVDHYAFCSVDYNAYFLVKCSVEYFTDYFKDGVSAVTCPALYLPKNIPSSTYLSAWETHIGNFPVFTAV